MTRAIAAFGFVLLAACSSSRPPAPPPDIVVDPHTDPTIVNGIDEAVIEGIAAAEEGAAVGRAVGRVAGVIAAVFGGPSHESLDEAVDRYRRVRDAGEAIGAIVGATRGISDGSERGHEFDAQFAELVKIEGVEATRPFPDEIQVRLSSAPAPETLAAIAAVFAGREERAIELEGPGNEVLTIREALIELGVPSTSLSARRNDAVGGVLLRVRYR